MRRLFDILCAALGLVLLAPVFVAIALAIRLEDGGPVFYVHPRVGKDFRKFGLLKFRTMVPQADRLGGPLTVAGDRRVTRLGRWLRTCKLDELPQLVNVLKGEMQLVGVRPESEHYVKLFAGEYSMLLRDRPGIADPASLVYGHEEQILRSVRIEEQYVTQILPHKLRLSAEYSEHRTFLSDLGILLSAVWRTLQVPSRQVGKPKNRPICA